MIKDQLYKTVFIPLAGAVLPLVTGLYWLAGSRLLSLFFTAVLYTAVAYAAWQLVMALLPLRQHKSLADHFARRLLVLTSTAFLASALVYLVATAIWQLLAASNWSTGHLWPIAVAGGFAGLVLALVYEAALLDGEKAQETLVLRKESRERQEAEASVLKNELDPHFFFNCMTALSHLVQHDAVRAHQFVHRLSNVYKYILRSKQKTYVSLMDEVGFLEDYYFLLRIRYDDNIRIHQDFGSETDDIQVLPCALQVLVENAIKHNFFSEREPLEISIRRNGSYIVVSNPVRPKPPGNDSTHIGLRNLKARYSLLTQQSVEVQNGSDIFLVKLPIVKTVNHDKSSNH